MAPWSVLSVMAVCVPCKNGWTHRDAAWRQIRLGPRNHELHFGAKWRPLSNTIEWSVRGNDAALCQITLTTCYTVRHCISDQCPRCTLRLAEWLQLGHSHGRLCLTSKYDVYLISLGEAHICFIERAAAAAYGRFICIKGSPYSIAERGVPELIPVLSSQPAGDVSHKPGGRLPLLSARPAVALATLKSCYQFRCLVNRSTMGVNSLPKTVTRQRRDWDLNPGPSAPESSTLTTRLPSHTRLPVYQTWNWVIGSTGQWVIWVIFHVGVTGSSFLPGVRPEFFRFSKNSQNAKRTFEMLKWQKSLSGVCCWTKITGCQSTQWTFTFTYDY